MELPEILRLIKTIYPDSIQYGLTKLVIYLDGSCFIRQEKYGWTAAIGLTILCLAVIR